jgi:hypothetical protein
MTTQYPPEFVRGFANACSQAGITDSQVIADMFKKEAANQELLNQITFSSFSTSQLRVTR